ncbi:MAG: cytochrome [Acidobacteriota bacterium]
MGNVVVGVMGPGETAADEEMHTAYDLGKLIAQRGWILLTGGRNCGVMNAAGQGAKAADGTVVGILPGADTGEMSDSVDIPIVTGMLDARNSINVLSCRILFFVGMNPGTASELALAVKYGKPAILVAQKVNLARIFQSGSFKDIYFSEDVLSAVRIADTFIEI